LDFIAQQSRDRFQATLGLKSHHNDLQLKVSSLPRNPEACSTARDLAIHLEFNGGLSV
jgi:hypothetical protein